jgi:poly(A) polymerase
LNGLLYDPLRDEVLDWVGGVKDIRDQRVRSIGKPRERFEEDKLRLLRAVRFATSLGFQIEDETGRALREMAGEIRVVSRERIRAELVKIFTGPGADRGLHLLDHYGLLEPILPEVARMKGVEQGERYHPEGDVFVHTAKILSFLSKPTVSLAFAALLHDVGKPPTYQPDGPVLFPNHAKVGADMSRDILNRLRFDRKTRDLVVASVANHLRFLDVTKMRASTLRRFILRDNFAEELELHRMDCLAGSGDLSNWEYVKEKLEELEREPLPPPPLLGGKDLLSLGFRAGPHMGQILQAVEEKRLEGELTSKEQAENWVLDNFKPDE